jgi:predicted regulator of Ras-like GTPase activity (Roadblock/LC7/MglB family)
MTTIEELESILGVLKNTEGVEASAVASRDGLLIYSTIPKKQPAETFAAMAATMIGAAETAASELGKGIPERIIVESKNGMIIGTGAGDKAFLIVMTQNGSNIDNIIKETAKASEKIEQVLSN